MSDRIGFFCDDTRDAVKGNVFDAANAGYVNGAPQCGYDVLHAVAAWRSGARGFRPRQAMQVVQYVSAHDNFTLWDKLAAEAAALAKSMTEKYERTWGWIGAPEFPMARPWEKLLEVPANG